MRNWLKENWFKFTITVLLSLLVGTFLYNSFVLEPKKQSFENCLKSYDSGWKEGLAGEPYFLSTIELCENGYSFSEFLALGRVVSSIVEAEYKEKYANVDDYWIQEKMKKEKADRLKEIIFSE